MLFNKYKISIVMTYFNRKNQLFRTLLSIKDSELSNSCEIIIVDDGSDDIHKIDFLEKFNLNFKLIEIKKEDKWYVNPCIPFNVGFKEATGDIILIQNAECMHFGDIIKHAYTLPEQEYWTYSVFSLTKEQTLRLDTINWEIENIKNILGTVSLANVGGIAFDGARGWYNHPVYRSVNYHFISAIYKKKLDQIGGFNEAFALGIGWEDNEFLYRIRKQLKVNTIVMPFGFHQWHYNYLWDRSKVKQDNKVLFSSICK